MERQTTSAISPASSHRPSSLSHDASSPTNGATPINHHHHRHEHDHHPTQDLYQPRPIYPTSPPQTDDDEIEPSSARVDAVRPKDLNCDRRRPEEEQADRSRLAIMSSKLIGQTVTPFLKDHVPSLYAPVTKLEQALADTPTRQKDPNSKYCYRHRPDSKCRRAADESKMVMIQSELEKLPESDQQAITHVWSLFSAAPSKHRELMIQGILSSSCFPQLSLVSREVQDQLKIDFITALPQEISLKILAYLDTVSLCKAAQVSQQWRRLADDDSVWHRMCEQHIDRKCTKCGWGLPLLERKRLRNWTRQQNLATTAHRLEDGHSKLSAPPLLPAPNTPKSPGSPKRHASHFEEEASSSKRPCLERVGSSEKALEKRPWKDVYRDRFKIGLNWRKLRYSLQIFQGHTNGITCVQLFDETTLATGSYDSTIKIWNIETGEEIRTLTGHSRGIRALQMDEQKLVSASLDHTVKVWNWKTGECLRTLSSHRDGVISVHFDGNIIASGSVDKSIRVYNFASGEAFCLKGVHKDWINQVKVDMASRTLLSASDDTTICLWDLDTKQVIRQYCGHVGHVQQVVAMPHDFEPDEDPATAGPDNADTLSVSSGRSATPAPGQSAPLAASTPSPGADDDLRVFYGLGFVHDPSRPLPARYILSGGLDASLKLWDTATGQCVRNQWGHLEGIWSVECDSLRMVTGANDSLVKTWDPRSGRCTGTFTGHRGPVTAVAVSDQFMASAGEDGEVRLYNFKPGSRPAQEASPMTSA